MLNFQVIVKFPALSEEDIAEIKRLAGVGDLVRMSGAMEMTKKVLQQVLVLCGFVAAPLTQHNRAAATQQ